MYTINIERWKKEISGIFSTYRGVEESYCIT